MAVVVALLKRAKNLTLHQNIAEVTFDNSYPTGGEPVTPAQFGVRSIDMMLITNNGGYIFEYDHVNNKIKAYNSTTGVALASPGSEVVAATNLSAVVLRALVIGL